MKEAIQPRKKFGFSKKINKEKKEDNINESLNKNENGNNFNNVLDESEAIINLKNTEKLLKGKEAKNISRITNCEDSKIELQTHFSCIYLKDNKNCVIKIGPVSSSIFVDNCTNCDLFLMGHQVIIHFYCYFI